MAGKFKNLLKPVSLFLLILSLICQPAYAKGSWRYKIKYREVKVSGRVLLIHKFSDKVVYYWDGTEWLEPPALSRSVFQTQYDALKSDD